MTLKAISFLGPTKYQPTTYTYGTQEYETQFFAEALPHFFPELDEILLFVTPTVKEHDNFLQLEHILGKTEAELRPVLIPEGHDERELWEIFSRFTEEIEPQDEIVFDITNSYRSFPFLVFLAAAYLRAARDVKVKRIIYGAFEARDKQHNRTPVFDLTPFIDLLDWLTATNQFIYTGDARYLASRLRKAGRARDSASLKQAGKQLENFSLAMMLCRPVEVMREAGKLSEVLEKAQEDLQEWARPFNLLTRRIAEEYQGRAVSDPETDVKANLEQQYRLILWYLENNQIIQAVTLAREWVISGVGWRQSGRFISEREERHLIANQLGTLSSKDYTEEAERLFLDSGLLPDEINHIKRLWNHLTAVRNDLDHVGMRRGAKKAEQLAKEAQGSLRKKIVTMAAIWDMSP